MNTVEFTCGHCGQTFAVAEEHLGQQVECPHCQQAMTLGPLSPLDTTERPDGRLADAGDTALGAVAPEVQPPAPAAPDSLVASAPENGAPAYSPGELPTTSEPLVRAARPSQAVPMVLVFLIPYALVTTSVAAYLFWKQAQRSEAPHPLEKLLDKRPDDGGPRQIKHDLPLPDHLKRSLKQPFRVEGFVEMTAERVELAPEGDQLTLTLHFRNISDQWQFNPFPESFLIADRGYTFLEFGTTRIYGGKLTWRRSPPGAGPFDGILAPGEESIVQLQTPPTKQARDKVKQLANYRGPLLWRLEIRRGMEEVKGQWVSTTTVVGIEFDAAVVLAQRIEDACLPSGSEPGA